MNTNRPLIVAGLVLVAGLFSLNARAAEEKSDPHLVGWWKFDETAGTLAGDASGHGRKGVLEGGGTFGQASAPGRIDGAVSLDGKNQSIRITNFKGIVGPKPRTVAAWIKTTSPSGELVSWGEDDGGKMFIFGFIRGRVGTTPKGGYLYMKMGVNDDKWHHVAVVVREGDPPNLHDDVKLYLDGSAADIDDIGLLDLWPIDTAEKLDVRIGRRFKGLIDDLRIYDRALTEDELKAIYRQAR